MLHTTRNHRPWRGSRFHSHRHRIPIKGDQLPIREAHEVMFEANETEKVVEVEVKPSSTAGAEEDLVVTLEIDRPVRALRR